MRRSHLQILQTFGTSALFLKDQTISLANNETDTGSKCFALFEDKAWTWTLPSKILL